MHTQLTIVKFGRINKLDAFCKGWGRIPMSSCRRCVADSAVSSPGGGWLQHAVATNLRWGRWFIRSFVQEHAPLALKRKMLKALCTGLFDELPFVPWHLQAHQLIYQEEHPYVGQINITSTAAQTCVATYRLVP